jgi:winged helix DNA-binding protein
MGVEVETADRIVLDRQQVNRYLTLKQHLAPESKATSVLRVVEDLVGLHGTSATGPYMALHARMRSFSRDDLDRELYERHSVLRLRTMRGTVFVLSHELARIAHAATRTMMLDRDRRYLAVDQTSYESIAPKVLEKLSGASLSTAELRSIIDASTDLSGVISLLSDEGLVVRDRPTGTWRSSAFRYRLWRDALPQLDLGAYGEQEAAQLLIRRYFAAYGPATVADAAWWTGLGTGAVRDVLKHLEDEVAQVVIAGLPRQFFMTCEDLAILQRQPAVRSTSVAVLPELDPLTMGYKDRERYVEPRHIPMVFDRGGNATSVILIDGCVAGVWDVTKQPEPGVRMLLFDKHQTHRRAVLERVASSGEFWFGRRVPVVEYSDMVPLTERSGAMPKPLDEAQRCR